MATTTFDQVHQFEPLMPTKAVAALDVAARLVVARSTALTGAAHPTTLSTLRTLVRSMNSYYSNRIEGQGTHPLDIERALRAEYASTDAIARLQRLARAHIEAEVVLEGLTAAPSDALRFSFLAEAHRELYSRLAEGDRLDDRGRTIVPGAFRDDMVSVGRHVPPTPESLPRFAARIDEVYGRRHSVERELIAIAAAHQRVSWVHPFRDGNGRSVRLQTHCALFPLSAGLWSVSRGLARKRDEYYAHLDAADAPRAGDLDGRGNLSDRALHDWCAWFLDLCRDQVTFMAGLLSFDGVHQRVRALIASRAANDQRYRIETVLPWFHAFAVGPVPRGEFQRMCGLGERTARSALSHLIRSGLLTSADHLAPVQVAFPLDCLQLLFPDLYPEAATRPPEA